MKILFFLLLASFQVFAVKPPEQNVIDQYVDLAIKTDEKTLKGKGKFECGFAMIHDRSMVAYGKKVDDAIQRLELLCIKSQCQKIGLIAQEGVDSVAALSEQEFRDFMEFSGATPQQIEIAGKNRSQKSDISDMTCENAPASYRMLAFDSCFAVPVECSKR